jgi:hypothetical protein
MGPTGSPAHFCSVPSAAQCTYDLRDKGTCEKLRSASTAEAMYAILTGDKNGAASSAA